MSGAQSPDILRPFLMRSSTPPHDEKVLLYLEGMNQAGMTSVGGSRPQSKYIDHEINDHPPPDPNAWKPMSPLAGPSPQQQFYASEPKPSGDTAQLEELARSELSYGEHVAPKPEDANSIQQEGMRTPSVRSHAIPVPSHEPGPDDEPGPHYVSYGSGPSFGNFGPLPRYSQDMYAHPPVLPSQVRSPSVAAAIPLPYSPRPTSNISNINIDVEPPSDPGLTANNISRADSRQSHRSDLTHKNTSQFNPPPQMAQFPGSDPLQGITFHVGPHGTTIHVPSPSQSRVASPVAAPQQPSSFNGGRDRPFSPASAQSHRSQAASPAPVQSVAGTQYPPLPVSRAGSNPESVFVPEPQYQSFAPLYGDIVPSLHKAPSQAPSKTPSNAGGNIGSGLASPRMNMAGKAPSNAESVRREETYHRHPTNGGGSAFGGSPGSAVDYAEVQSPLQSPPLPIRPTFHGSPVESTRVLSPQRSQQGNGYNGLTSPRAQPLRSRALSPPESYAGRSQRSGVMPAQEQDVTPTQSRVQSPFDYLDDQETEIVRNLLNSKTPRTSIAPSALAEQVSRSHFHDQDLCILLHAADDPMTHDVVKKAVRKAVSARLKKLNMKHDKESIRAYRKSFHDHDPSWHQHNPHTTDTAAPVDWGKMIMDKITVMENRVAELGPKIDSLKSEGSRRSHSHRTKSSRLTRTVSETIPDEYEERTPRTQTIPIPDHGTIADSIYHPPETEFTSRTHDPTTMPGSMHPLDASAVGTAVDEFEDDNETQAPNGREYLDGDSRRYGDLSNDRGDSPGQQYLEEELYKLRVRQPSQSAPTHRSWEIAREDGGDEGDDDDDRRAVTESELPEISGEQPADYDGRVASPPLPPLPAEAQDVSATGQGANPWGVESWNQSPPVAPAWQRIHQRLLNWAIVWPMSELDAALNSTLRGFQVDEVALSIWSTQQYKRYVRNQLTEVPPGRVDRLFVPPNMADAINNAVFHGRHGDACSMLRDLWSSCGLEGLPRLIIVLCKHRTDPNHWVAHKFSLPDGTLTTYDTYPEKCLPDGRPLGWWFAIRIAWPTAMYPSPDHLMQKMVRLHRPMQLAIDNSVAAAGIWRNLLMSSRPERPLDLERLRDLINTEVKNLRQRKEQGKLSASATRANWDDLGI